MNLKRKKKKGSSLLIVVAMMSILSILIISILAMTTSGYKLRVQANSRMENFYGADSGLEISEKLLHDYVKIAAEYSNKKVDANSSIVQMNEKRRVFKETFIKFFQQGGKQADIVPTNFGRATLDPSYEYQKATNELSKKEHYSKFDRDNIDITKSKLYYKTKVNNNWLIIDSINPADLTASDVISDYQGVTHLRMYFESTYTDKGNQRVVGVNFDVKIPEYGRELTNSDKAKAPKVFDFIFAADGNYELAMNNVVNMYGDLWVKGSEIKDLTISNKYDSGITFKTNLSQMNLTLNGGISTNGTLSLENVNLLIDSATNKNIYANNFVSNNDFNTTMKSNLKVSDLYVYNDFVSRGNKNEIYAKNYYGLNEYNSIENTSIEGIASREKLERSSSMIIDSKDFGVAGGSKIDINGEAYILGTSYIDIGNGYQTGYSSMINRLTKPYTARDDAYSYKYIDSLQIIDGKVDGGSYTLEEKINIAKAYGLEEGDKVLAKGMTVPKSVDKKSNIFNTGVILANDAVNMPNLPSRGNIDSKKIEYAKEVFNMGDDKGVTVDTFNNKEMKIDVNDSFNWTGVSDVANKNYTDADGIKKIVGNGTGFADLELQKNVGYIMNKAYYAAERPNLAAYDREHAFLGAQKPRIILNSTGKKLIIKQVASTTGNDIVETTDTINYKMVTPINTQVKQPVLIISNSDVSIIPIDIYSYIMTLCVGDIRINNTGLSTSTIGNFATPSIDGIVSGYKGGQFNFTNELFKYILEDGDLMGDIGNDIFATGEVKEVKEAIEISSLIKKQNWKIIK